MIAWTVSENRDSGIFLGSNNQLKWQRDTDESVSVIAEENVHHTSQEIYTKDFKNEMELMKKEVIMLKRAINMIHKNTV